MPTTALSYYAFAALIRKHALSFLPFNSTDGQAPIPATVTTYSVPNFSDYTMYGVSLMLDQDKGTTSDAEVGFFRYRHNASVQVFDFSSTPVAPGALTYDQGSTDRPVISWSNKDPLSTVKTLTLNYRAPANDHLTGCFRWRELGGGEG